MNDVVKIKTDEYGDKIKHPKWCLVDPCNHQGCAALCTQMFFGEGESGCEYEAKIGNVTCKECISKIKTYQKIKL